MIYNRLDAPKRYGKHTGAQLLVMLFCGAFFLFFLSFPANILSAFMGVGLMAKFFFFAKHKYKKTDMPALIYWSVFNNLGRSVPNQEQRILVG